MKIASPPTACRLSVLAAVLAGLSSSACAVPANVVISQIYGGGGSASSLWNRDFVELFNRSAAPVSLNGMSLQYQAAAGTTWQAGALPDVTLQPGQYFLVAGGASSGADIGAIDHSWSTAIAATAGKVALASIARAMSTAEGEAIIDLVGFGSANRFETAVAPAPSISTSIARAGLGCIDTDNNALDFTAGPVVGPRRASSPFNSCGGPVVQPIVLTCPASVQVAQGSAITALLSAQDGDSRIIRAAIEAGAANGISLSNFAASSAIGASASATLSVDASVAAGSYALTVGFGNSEGESATCKVTVSVAGQLTIPQIQGAGATSPYNNTVQSTQGVVTAIVGSGYFLQDAQGDGDPATSDAIFVYGSSTGVTVGDLLRITGTVTEYTPTGATRSYTEFKDISAQSQLGSGISLAPTNVVMPNADLARFEGMLVRFTTPLTVNGNAYLGERGELTLSAGRREIPTNRYPAGSSEARALATENAQNIVVLDDGIFVTPTTIPYLFADGTVRSGDTVTDLTGVLDFGAIGGGGAYFKLQPTVTPSFSRTNERLPAPQVAAGNVRVASANVLNFFTTFTNGADAWGRTGQGCTIGSTTRASNCRGADNLAEFVRQRDKIVASLAAINADVVGLMEIQNNDDIAASYLVEQLNLALGSPAYAVVPKPATSGTDAIRVAMIYKPQAVSLVGGALSDGDAINNRAPMAQTFKAANGARFSLVVNHLKSKGSCSGAGTGDIDSGDGQGCWNATRLRQVTRLRDYFLPLVAATANDADVLVVGDMNAYGMEDPIRLLNAAGYVNELERNVRPYGIPYSYVFGSESGYLDHALASTSLSAQVAGVTEWHNNADEPQAIDYNLEGGAGYYQSNPYRASDHDPVVVSLNLTPIFSDVSSAVSIVNPGMTLNRVSGKYTGTVKITNTSVNPLTGPLQLLLQSLPAGVTLDAASGQQGGAPYLSLPGTGLAPGASISVSLSFTNPSKTSITFSTKLISGTF